MEIYNLLDSKFEQILSGTCLTSYREENKKISKKYESMSENKLMDMKNDFSKYVQNYLFLKGYNIESATDDVVIAIKDNNKFEFLIDFDWGTNDGNLKLKILDRGLKTGISKYDSKYLFVVSVEKGLFFLLNGETLKKQIKENRDSFKILTENDNLFKTQYVNFEILDLGQKAKIFSLK
jgi:hypothetical protein